MEFIIFTALVFILSTYVELRVCYALNTTVELPREACEKHISEGILCHWRKDDFRIHRKLSKFKEKTVLFSEIVSLLHHNLRFYSGLDTCRDRFSF